MEDDPTREIFGYCSHIPVPKWVDSGASSTCKHCNSKFSVLNSQRNQHNCRLCGELVCSSCTGKYYLPFGYEPKAAKKGVSRVCIKCRDLCLKQKEAEKQTTFLSTTQGKVLRDTDLLSPKSQAKRLDVERAALEIAPPKEWEDKTKYTECKKCHKKGGKGHTCRACGLLFCDGAACMAKLELPAFFDKKTKRSGMMKVCMECRFKILGGAKLVERLTSEIEAEAEQAKIASGETDIDPTTACIVSNCRNPRISTAGYCAKHVNELGGSMSGSDLSNSFSIAVRWEGTAHNLTKIAFLDNTMNLLQIDLAFRRQCPEFARREDIEYVYEGEGIHEVFYDLFLASAFAKHSNVLSIRKKIDSDLLVAEYTKSAGTSPAVKPIGASPLIRAGSGNAATASSSLLNPNVAPNLQKVKSLENGKRNPFKRQDSQNALTQGSTGGLVKTNSGGVGPPPRPGQVKKKAFRKPTINQSNKFTIAPSSSPTSRKPVPPALPGQSPTASPNGPRPPPLPAGSGPRPPPISGSSGPATADVFRQRAKLHFGAY